MDSRNVAETIRNKIVALDADPYAPNNNATKLQNRVGYRLRVGDWRVLYELDDPAADRAGRKAAWRRIPMKTEIIERKGKPFAVVPLKEFERIRHDAKMLDEIRAYDAAKSRGEETFPAGVADDLMEGNNPIRVFRQYRGMTQEQLAKTARLARA